MLFFRLFSFISLFSLGGVAFTASLNSAFDPNNDTIVPDLGLPSCFDGSGKLCRKFFYEQYIQNGSPQPSPVKPRQAPVSSQQPAQVGSPVVKETYQSRRLALVASSSRLRVVEKAKTVAPTKTVAPKKRKNKNSKKRGASKKQKPTKRKSSSGYRGVTWNKWHQKWTAQIRYGGKQHHIGVFVDPVTAARAYDAAARDHHGLKSVLNFPNESLTKFGDIPI